MLPEFNAERCIGCFQCVRACPMGVLGKGEDQHPKTLPHRRCIECMHCAAICPRQAVRFPGLSDEMLYQDCPAEGLEPIVRKRRSVRTFQSRLPQREDIQWALDTAEYAPSGKNVHATCWSVLWGKEMTDQITDRVLEICEETGEAPELPKLFRKGTNLITCGAPCLILGWSPDDCLNPVIDTAVAMTTVELLLQSRGLATCWGGYLNQIANHNPALSRLLGVPEGCHLRCALMVGYPKYEIYRNIPYRPKAPITWIENLN